MTRSRMAEVECDWGSEPGAGAFDCDAVVIERLLTEALETARLQGWQLGRVLDFCPEHRTVPARVCVCGGDPLGPQHEQSLLHKKHVWTLEQAQATETSDERLVRLTVAAVEARRIEVEEGDRAKADAHYRREL